MAVGALLALTIRPAGRQTASMPEAAADSGPLQLVDVAAEVGLGDFQHGAFRWGFHGDPVAMMGGGLCWIDYDLDGWLDLYVVNSYAVNEAGRWETEMGGLPHSVLYKNEDGMFRDVAAITGTDFPMRGNGCVAADFNLDGWPDLYVTTSRANFLLWNNGDGTFTEGAADAGAAAYGWQTAAAVGDINGDGWPDLFLAGYVDINNRIEGATMGFPNTHLGRRDLLLLSQGNNGSGRVTFREVGEAAGIETIEPYEYGLGALMTDVDHDGDLDLLVANDTNPNRLYENRPVAGGGAADETGLGFRLVEVGGQAGIDDTNSGMGIAAGDFDENGRDDLLITNLGAQLHSVYANQSDGETIRFDDAANDLGLAEFGVGWTGWGTSWFDLDHDTDLDLIIANGKVPVVDFEADALPTVYFANQTAQGRRGQLIDATARIGLDDVPPLVSRGSAAADYDNDGDLDIAIASIGGPLRLLENRGEKGSWLQIAFDGPAPGTVIEATLPDGRILRREMHVGSSYLASEDPRCHFGLGDATQLPELLITWPDGRQTRFQEVDVNQVIWVSP